MLFEDASQNQETGLKFAVFHENVPDAQCGLWRSGPLRRYCPHTGACRSSDLCHSTSKEVSQGQQAIVNLPLVFQRPGFPYNTEWVGLGGCCYDSLCLWQMNLSRLRDGCSRPPDRLLQRRLPPLIPCTCIELLWGPRGSEWADWFICWALYLLAYPLRTRQQSWQGNYDG